MEVQRNDISKVCKKLKQIRGETSNVIDIPYIDTLCGKYSKQNILEGFRANTEVLCNENQENSKLYNQVFYSMCVKDLLRYPLARRVSLPHVGLPYYLIPWKIHQYCGPNGPTASIFYGIWITKSGTMVFILNLDKVSLKKLFPTMNI